MSTSLSAYSSTRYFSSGFIDSSQHKVYVCTSRLYPALTYNTDELNCFVYTSSFITHALTQPSRELARPCKQLTHLQTCPLTVTARSIEGLGRARQ